MTGASLSTRQGSDNIPARMNLPEFHYQVLKLNIGDYAGIARFWMTDRRQTRKPGLAAGF
jgi:hypothetical protein